MENQAVARGFMQHYLPKDIRQALDLDSLALEHDSFIDSSLQEAISDLVFSCKLAGQPAYLAMLIEHQSRPDPHMPVRIGHYLFSLLVKQLKQHPSEPLPPVYAMVFYHGQQTPYPFSLKLADCFNDPLGLMKNLFQKPLPLVDINQLDDAELKQQKWIGIVTRALKKIRQDDLGPDLLEWLEDCAKLTNHDPQWSFFVRSLIYYAMNTGSVADQEQLLEESRRLPKPIGDLFMTIAEQLEARGEAKGEAKGRKATAVNLLNEGAEPEFVARVTGLTVEEVKALGN